MKALPLTTCKNCTHFIETPYPPDDSWERPAYWWCSHPNVEEITHNDQDENHKSYLKKNHEKIRMIGGYIEWHEEKGMKIPTWCPLPDI